MLAVGHGARHTLGRGTGHFPICFASHRIEAGHQIASGHDQLIFATDRQHDG